MRLDLISPRLERKRASKPEEEEEEEEEGLLKADAVERIKGDSLLATHQEEGVQEQG